MEQSFFNYNLRPNFSINDYFVGKSNIEAYNLLVNNKNINNLFLVGPSKSGKTHLAFIWQKKFNAIIYVADLVCLAMVREMGALMVAIIMAGRTGAAFAAEIGSMKLNEEIDSLRTFGISPMEFLIIPRTLSLLMMIPLLTIYADVVGILGGLVVGTMVMDFSVIHYFVPIKRNIYLTPSMKLIFLF